MDLDSRQNGTAASVALLVATRDS